MSKAQETSQGRPGVDIVDVRGPRFSAAVTCVVLSAAFVSGWLPLLALQVLVFAVAAIAGLRWSPYGQVFRLLKRRLDLGPPPATEPAAGPRFSQAMGLLCAGAGLAALLAGWETLGWALVVVVIGLSALLAVTGLCIGCELYGLGQRARAALPAASGQGRR